MYAVTTTVMFSKRMSCAVFVYCGSQILESNLSKSGPLYLSLNHPHVASHLRHVDSRQWVRLQQMAD